VHATGELRVLPHFDFASAPPIDLLVIPGGFGTRQLLDDLEVREWIKNVANNARLTTSVCTGALLLAKAGLRREPHGTVGYGLLAAGLGGWHPGFSQTQSTGIVLAEVLNAAWIVWLLVVAGRMPDREPASLGR